VRELSTKKRPKGGGDRSRSVRKRPGPTGGGGGLKQTKGRGGGLTRVGHGKTKNQTSRQHKEESCKRGMTGPKNQIMKSNETPAPNGVSIETARGSSGSLSKRLEKKQH